MRVRIPTLVTSGLLSALVACSSSSPTEPQLLYDGNDNADSTAVILHQYYSGFGESERLVVRDSAQWASVWATAFAGLLPSLPPLPPVDFSREMVIVAALGGRPSGGYDISIERVTAGAGGPEVSVVAISPGEKWRVLSTIAGSGACNSRSWQELA